MTLLNLYKIIFIVVPVVSGSLLLSGCATSRKADFYQLEETANAALIGVEKGPIIGLGPIHLPEYINRPQIVTRSSKHHLTISEFNRWIEPVNDSISRLLLINLSNNLNSNRVYGVPKSDRQYPLELRVAIDIGRFDGQLGKTVFLESRWSIFDKNDRPLLTRVSLIKSPVNGEDYEALVSAMNNALLQLGKEISQASESFLGR